MRRKNLKTFSGNDEQLGCGSVCGSDLLNPADTQKQEHRLHINALKNGEQQLQRFLKKGVRLQVWHNTEVA